MNYKLLPYLVLLMCSTQSVVAQETYTFGIGERYDTVSQPWNPCGTNANVVAQDTCSVHMPSRTIERFGYVVDQISSNGGNRCGYTKFSVGCFGMPGIAQNRTKKFKVGEKDADYGCGTDAMLVAKDFCTVKGPNPTEYPFTIRRTNTVDGNKCGYNTFEVKCRTPFPPRAIPIFEQ